MIPPEHKRGTFTVEQQRLAKGVVAVPREGALIIPLAKEPGKIQTMHDGELTAYIVETGGGQLTRSESQPLRTTGEGSSHEVNPNLYKQHQEGNLHEVKPNRNKHWKEGKSTRSVTPMNRGVQMKMRDQRDPTQQAENDRRW